MEDLANYPGLKRRGNTWYVRKRVPQDVADAFKGKELKRSLKTQDKTEAMGLYHQALSAIESKFETARLKKNNPEAHDLLSTYDEAGILGLVYDWYTDTSDRLRRINSTATKTFDDEDIKQSLLEDEEELARTIAAMNKKNYEIIRQDVREWLKERGITYNPISPVYQQFCYNLMHSKKTYRGAAASRFVPYSNDEEFVANAIPIVQRLAVLSIEKDQELSSL